MRINVGLKYGSPGKRAFFNDRTNKFPAFVGGFGAGKTYVGLKKLLDLTLHNYELTGRSFKYMAVEPDYPMVERIMYPTLFEDILDPMKLPYHRSKDKTAPFVDLPWKARIYFYSAKIPKSIVGSNYAGAYVDEAALMHKLAWLGVGRRLRNKGAPLIQAFTTFTAELPAWTHDLWGREELEGEPLPKNYAVYHGSTRENPCLPDDYADDIASEVTEEEAVAVVDGHFTSTKTGKVYHTYNAAINKTTVAQYDPALPLGLAFDFNPGAVGVTVEVCQQNGPHFYVVGEINISRFSLEETCGHILDVYGNHQKAPVIIYGDATGHRSTSAKAEYSVILDILGKEGFAGKESYCPPFRVPVTKDVPKANPSVADRCSAVRTLLCNSKGDHRLFVNPACKKLTRDFGRVVYETYHKQQAGKVYPGNSYDLCKCDGEATHASDALGYYIYRVRPRKDAFVRQSYYKMK